MKKSAVRHAINEPSSVSEGARAILCAAEQLFAEKGFDAVAISEIAEKAGVSKANIFHHFNSKNELYISVLRTACEESAHLLQDLASEAIPFQQRLSNFVDSHLVNMLDHALANQLILRELLENGGHRGKELAEQVFGEHFSRLVLILREGQKQGILRRNLDSAMLAALLVGANVFFFESREVLRHFPEVTFADEPAKYNRMLMDILFNGVLSDPKKSQKTTAKKKNKT